MTTPLARLSDEELVANAKTGDTTAFAELVERYKERTVRLACGYTHNFHDAKDAAQEAFVKVHAALGRFDGRSKFSTWLYRIVANSAIDFMRKSREKTLSDPAIFETLEDRSPDAAEGLRQEASRAAIDRAVDKLSPQQKTVIVLTYFNELSTAETAAVMQISEGTVKATRFQALAKLKKEMADQADQKEATRG